MFSGLSSTFGLGYSVPTLDQHPWNIDTYRVNRDDNNSEVYLQIRNGDVIELKREEDQYSHWGIAKVEVKNGEAHKHLIHFMSRSGLDLDAGVYQIDDLWGAIKDRWIQIHIDEDLQPLAISDTIKRARSKLYRSDRYNLYSWNCEHFVMWCKYGISLSHQIEKIRSTFGELTLRIGGAIGTVMSAFSNAISGPR